MKKKLLVLGAGTYQAPLLRRLREAGFTVLAADRNPAAAGGVFADRFRPIDITDTPRILAWAGEERVDGVMPLNDFGTPTAAFVASELGLPGISPETAERSVDKSLMRQVWADAGLPQPEFTVISSPGELPAAAASIGFPCVVKPALSGGGGRGVSMVFSPGDLERAFAVARPYCRNEKLLVEKHLEGTEMTVETLSVEGRVTVLAMSDKEKSSRRPHVASSLNFPAAGSPEVLEAVRELARKAVLALGIDNGMGHTEIMATERGPRLVETGARGGGGHLFSPLIEAVSGICAPVVMGRILTGLELELPEPMERGAVYRFFFPPPGRLREIRHRESALGIPGVLELEFAVKPGDRIVPVENGLDRAGCVVTSGKDRAEAMAIADEVESLVEIVVDPESRSEAEDAPSGADASVAVQDFG